MTPGPAPTVRRPAVEISATTVASNSELLHANLERPVGEEAVDGFYVPLVGWALATGGQHVDIQIAQGAQVLRRLARRQRRPDIASSYPEVAGAQVSGFSLALEALRLPCEFELSVCGVVGDETLPFASVQGARRRLRPVADLSPAPLMVTTLGRTGSTLLMTLLSVHPSIAAYRPVAHDSRPFAHWLDAAIAMASPSSRMQTLDSSMAGGTWWLGAEPVSVEALHQLEEPVRRLLVGEPLEALLQSAVARASRFADALAGAEGHGDTAYAAEKCWPGHVPRLLSELCAEGREIFLVRDFRDVFASMLAFNAKRGYAAFGREHVDDDEQFLARLSHDVQALAHSYDERSERALLVQYERLVDDPQATLAEILAYLELDAAPASVAALVERAQTLLETTRSQHRTSDDASRSSGRWREDLPEPLQQACTEVFEGPLRRFGYL